MDWKVYAFFFFVVVLVAAIAWEMYQRRVDRAEAEEFRSGARQARLSDRERTKNHRRVMRTAEVGDQLYRMLYSTWHNSPYSKDWLVRWVQALGDVYSFEICTAIQGTPLQRFYLIKIDLRKSIATQVTIVHGTGRIEAEIPVTKAWDYLSRNIAPILLRGRQA